MLPRRANGWPGVNGWPGAHGISPGRQVTFTMTAANPSVHPLSDAQVYFVVYPDRATKKSIDASQLHLSYSTSGPGGHFSTVVLGGSTGGGNDITGHLGSASGRRWRRTRRRRSLYGPGKAVVRFDPPPPSAWCWRRTARRRHAQRRRDCPGAPGGDDRSACSASRRRRRRGDADVTNGSLRWRDSWCVSSPLAVRAVPAPLLAAGAPVP